MARRNEAWRWGMLLIAGMATTVLAAGSPSLVFSQEDGARKDEVEKKDASAGPTGKQAVSLLAKTLPFPRDARGVEFHGWRGDIEYTSRSSLASLAAFYRQQLKQRGWTENESAVKVEDDTVELKFTHAEAVIELELDRDSRGTVDVSLDTKGLDFKGTDDPARLLAAGVPQSRANLFLQKQFPLPKDILDLQYSDDRSTFKSKMALKTAFDHFSKMIKDKGYRESRRPIVTKTRLYTEFQRGPITLSVNVFTHEVGSRILLGYEDDRKEPLVAPLPAVAALPKNPQSGTEEGKPAPLEESKKTAVVVANNKGSATVTFGKDKFVFRHVAAYRTKRDGDNALMLVFADRKLPLQKMQKMLATEDDFLFGDLFEFKLPRFLKVRLGDPYTGFSFSIPGVGIGRGVEDPIRELKVEEGRVRATVKMRAPEEIFKKPFQFDVSIDAGMMTPTTRVTGVKDPPTIDPFSPNVRVGFPLPDGADDASRQGSNYRKVIKAKSALSVGKVVEFYRQQAQENKWETVASDATSNPAASETLNFRNSLGPVRIELKQGPPTEINITTRNEAKAKADGILPEAGKARLVMANGHTREVVIQIGKTNYRLRAGRGMKDPKQALNYSIPAGKYSLTIKIPGERPKIEKLDIAEGTTWGVLTLPTGGYLAYQFY